MTSKLDHALSLARDGFWVFPIRANSKKPAVKFKEWATRDEAAIRAWWASHPDHNIGIYTGKFGDDQALLVVDVDNKNGKRGDDELAALEMDDMALPPTRESATPTGGRHLMFRVASPVKQGANVLGIGLDVRSRGGYIAGPGSTIDGGMYASSAVRGLAPAPEWVVRHCEVQKVGEQRIGATVSVDRAGAMGRAMAYVASAPVSVEGAGGDECAYKVAARLKDFGVAEDECFAMMLGDWNDRCQPPWSPDELRVKVRNAYAYGQEPIGAAAPEADFKPIVPAAAPAVTDKDHPWDELNREFAFVLAGGGSHILWETTDAEERPTLVHLAEAAFHKKFAAVKMTLGKRAEPITEQWMEWEGRRSYDGIVFMPALEAPARFYNLWRGFSCEPWPADAAAPPQAQAALDAWLDHAKVNVCGGSATLTRWLLGYFAHLVQRPWEKPLVSLVFRGAKGVGKNALVQIVGELLGSHFLLTSNRRYLVGNFNGHLENCLLFVLDEAFWSGDKQAEGTLKDLITGQHHVIEHKGKEPYTVDNRTRIAIIGNEDWLVPASHDERRFAIFHVGEGRKQDRAFFQAMREGMEAGGYRLLLRFLKEYDLAGLDLNAAPLTAALLDQKHSSLEVTEQWWLTCLFEGRLVGSDFEDAWPRDVLCDRFRAAITRYHRDHNVRGKVPADIAIGRQFTRACPLHTKARLKSNGPYVYRLPPLSECRAAWDKFIGHAVDWPE